MFAHGPAAALQQTGPTIPSDTSQAAVVETPLPGGVGAFVRTIFNQPAWLQIGVIVACALIAIVVIMWLWFDRDRLIAWLRARSRAWKIALAAIALLTVTGATSFGVVSWNYTQHNNDFCIGCHVMGSAWTRFQHSEHRKLKCHDCHQQSIFASMRQLYLWVAERPSEIPPHAKVPTAICKTCHDQAKPDSVWKHIVATAGHSVHLRNDDPKLKNVQCVTCHGAEVHHFVPVDKTCGQAGCHDKLQIKLGKMAGQTSLHCTGCHNFTAPVADNVSPDSASKTLAPTGGKCLDCHAMKQRLAGTFAELEPHREPHKAVCGSCHNPHTQSTTKQAFESCATAQCHARADTLTPFHRGLSAGALANCGTCHKAHVWKVPSKACATCHRDLDHPLRDAGVHRAQKAADELSAHAPTTAPTPPAPHGPFAGDDRDSTDAEPAFEAPPRAPHVTPPQRTDTAKFTHARHRTVACGECHSSTSSHGEITIARPAGCLACHHSPKQQVACTSCHATPAPRDRAVNLSMTVWKSPRSRSLPFAHDRHAKVSCRTCHNTPNTLAVGKTCASCHTEHHGAAANCASCHPPIALAAQTFHPRSATHAGCGGSGCHSDPMALALPPSRAVCVTCHRGQVNHKPGGDCGTCHLVGWGTSPQGGSR